MAESLDGNESPSEIFDLIKQNQEISRQVFELEKELMELESCQVIDEENKRLEKVIEDMESMKSAFQSIVDNRTTIVNRLKSPLVPNALPVQYSQQENFVMCCKKLPLIAKKFEAEQKQMEDGDNSHSLPNGSLLAKNMEKELDAVEGYISHVKRFISDKEELEKKFDKIAALVEK